MIETMKITLPAEWASALVNGNIEDLEFNEPEAAAKLKSFIEANDDIKRFISVGPAYSGTYNGKTTEVADYDAVMN